MDRIAEALLIQIADRREMDQNDIDEVVARELQILWETDYIRYDEESGYYSPAPKGIQTAQRIERERDQARQKT